MKKKFSQSAKRWMTCLAKKSAVSILVVVVSVAQHTYFMPSSTIVYAKEMDSGLNEHIMDATSLMQELLEYQYEKEKESFEAEIKDNGWDYYLSMQAFDMAGNPYQDLNYEEIIAALCMVVGQNPDYNIKDIPMLYATYETCQYEKSIPLKTTRYKEVGNGLYEEDGIYYITEDGTYPVYEKQENGLYIKTAVQDIKLETETVVYGSVSLRAAEAEDILSVAGLSMEDEKTRQEYEKRLLNIQNAGLTEEGLGAMTFLAAAGNVCLDDEILTLIEELNHSLTGNRLEIVKTAVQLIGQVPYQWGGKSEKPGYDTSWWSYQNGQQKGLDCSGYVQWVFRTAGYSESTWQSLGSTASILGNCDRISENELQAGDLGLLMDHGEGINHVGIYLGDGYYIHCSSSAKTVTISKPEFTVFMRVKNVDTECITPYVSQNTGTTALAYSEDELYLIAQTVWHEARGEGINGWIAVTEVIKNRILSPSYPNDARSVIYQEEPRQFEHNERIEQMEPSDVEQKIVKMVLDGQLGILNDPQVLYFRNPGNIENNEDWGKFPFYMRINNTVFYRQA